jgi:hypothetical protein
MWHSRFIPPIPLLTIPLPPYVDASIWVISYFGLLWDDSLCIDSTLVEDYWVQERGFSHLRAIDYNRDRLGKDKLY